MKHRTRIALVVVSIVAASGLAVGFYFTRRPEVTTRSEAARKELAEAEADIGRYYNADARAHLAKALELDPEFPLALVLMAEFEAGRGQRERAKGYVERAAASLDRVTPIERYRILVMQAALEGNEDEVDKLMAEAWKEFPRDRWVLERMAGKTFREGKAEESMSLYRKLLDVYPDSATAYNLLGYTAARQGKFAEAEEYFAKYAFIAGEQANPHDSVGELFLNTGRYDDAEKALRKALEIRPDFTTSELNLALLRRKQGRLDESIEILRAAIPRLEQYEWALQARVLLGFFLMEKGETAEARRVFDELAATPQFVGTERPLKVTIPVFRAHTWLAEGKVAEAERIAEEVDRTIEASLAAPKATPVPKTSQPITEKSREDTLLLKGMIAGARGDHEKALALMQKIEVLRNGLPFGSDYIGFFRIFRIRLELAKELQALGRTGEAAVELAKNLAIDPKDRQTLEALAKLPGPPVPPPQPPMPELPKPPASVAPVPAKG